MDDDIDRDGSATLLRETLVSGRPAFTVDPPVLVDPPLQLDPHSQ